MHAASGVPELNDFAVFDSLLGFEEMEWSDAEFALFLKENYENRVAFALIEAKKAEYGF
jgi:hypothetical protein